MAISLKNTNSLVIGGSRGIGAAVVRQIAAAGGNVHWTMRDTAAGGTAGDVLAESLREYGVRATCEPVDCTDPKATAAMVEKMAREYGGIDYLVYCAGFTSPVKFLDVTPADWRRVIDINLNGAFFAARAVLPHMVDRQRGAIVLIGSAAIASGGGGRADYVAGKAGLEGLNRAITKEFAPAGIRCNLVHPALIDTDLLKQRHPDLEKRRELAAEVPLRRLGLPDDVAHVVLFLLSDKAGYIAGQSLYVDGGRTFCR